MSRTFINRLTGDRSAIELCFLFRWPGWIRTNNFPVKSRVHLPIELQANLVMTNGFEPLTSIV
jgi:hypothetical protein